jgi:hypothetical protein
MKKNNKKNQGNANDTIKILGGGNFVCVQARLTRWSGATALEFKDELNVDNDDGVYRGTKSICPKGLLSPFSALDKNSRRQLSLIGIQVFPGIWAMPVSRLTEVDELLQDIQNMLDMRVQEFSARYDDACEDYFSKLADGHRLRRYKLPLADAASRFSFSSSKFQLAETEHSGSVDDSILMDSFTSAVVAEATDIRARWGKFVEQFNTEGKSRANIHSLNALYLLRDKIKGFSTLSSQAFALGVYIEEKLASLPSIAGFMRQHYMDVIALLELLTNPQTVQSFGTALIEQMRAQQASQFQPAFPSVPQQAALPTAAAPNEPAAADDLPELDLATQEAVEIEAELAVNAPDPMPESEVLPGPVVTSDNASTVQPLPVLDANIQVSIENGQTVVTSTGNLDEHIKIDYEFDPLLVDLDETPVAASFDGHYTGDLEAEALPVAQPSAASFIEDDDDLPLASGPYVAPSEDVDVTNLVAAEKIQQAAGGIQLPKTAPF